MRQSSEALPQEMTELNMALTMRLLVLLYTKYIAAEHSPAENVANTAPRDTLDKYPGTNEREGTRVIPEKK